MRGAERREAAEVAAAGEVLEEESVGDDSFFRHNRLKVSYAIYQFLCRYLEITYYVTTFGKKYFQYGLGHNKSSNKYVKTKNLIKNFLMHKFKISQHCLIDIDQSYNLMLRLFRLDF